MENNSSSRAIAPVAGLPLFVRAVRSLSGDAIAWGKTRRPTWDFTITADGKQFPTTCYRSRFYDSDTPKAWDLRRLDEKQAKAILAAVLLDADCYENARDFADFAGEFGLSTDKYHDDSIETRETWKECRRASEALHEIASDEVLRQAREALQD